MTDEPAKRVEAPGPADFHDPLTRHETKRAIVWISLAMAVVLVWLLAQPLLLIIGGMVFASMLDGGTRLLGRVLPIGRGWRLAIVCVLTAAFLFWVLFYAGYTLAAQAEELRVVVTAQFNRIFGWARTMNLIGASGANDIGRQLMGSLGQVTAVVGSALGAVSSLAMILVIGIFIAIEPRLYERGLAWMLPIASRGEFYETAAKMGRTLRRLMAGRLLGMAVEGVGTWVFLAIGGVPMAALLGILTGLLAFLPNIGAIVSGVLIVLVGFSAGFETGIWAIAVYVGVQVLDGYVIVPMVAKRSVDLAPALILGAQLLFGALFGIMGLALADPIVAMLKVLLEERAGNAAEAANPPAAGTPGG